MQRYRKKIIFTVIIIVLIYMLGPAPTVPKWDNVMPSVPIHGEEIEAYIHSQEQKHKLKPDNEARIVWFSEDKNKTEYSLVYLHGFSASQGEGAPVHLEFAKRFKCNLFLSRLADHGIDTTEQLLYFTVDRLWNSAKQALAVGKAIGNKVIIMSTSTGGSMALVLAATYPNDVHALINMSPNIRINDPFAFMLNDHWGLQIARLVMGGKYMEKTQTPKQERYWYKKYRLEAVVQLQELLESKMIKETFKRVHQPTLNLYYYKNDQQQDQIVKVDALLKMHELLGTPKLLKVEVPIPNAKTHVIGSGIVSKDTETVMREGYKFAEEKLQMTPVN